MKEFARHLRANQTDAERLLWSRVRNRQLSGYKFRRQLVIEPYIVDFACLEQKLIVELDGGHHAEQQKQDERRSLYLQRLGYRILRFWNHDVLREPDAVLESIRIALADGSPHPNPSPIGRGA
jgi:very-short-patch-repair endonuclease